MDPSMIQLDADGQLVVKLPAFVHDPEAYLRQDTLVMRRHLDRMDAQAYGMLIWRTLQLDVLDQILLHHDDSVFQTTGVSIAFEPHPTCPKNVAQAVAQSLEENLNQLQSDALAEFINRLKSSGWMSREKSNDLIADAYDRAFKSEDQGWPSWKEAQSLQESLRLREHTQASEPTTRPRNRI